MINDRHQKQKLLFYYLSRFWYPQLEVQLRHRGSMNAKPRIITDIDVLALAPSDSGLFSPVIGDCKTLKNQSPINRAFWLRGVMDWFGASAGIVLLAKQIESEHKLLASDLNISLLSEGDFKQYTQATAKEIPEVFSSFLGDMENWETYFALGKQFPRLNELIDYCQIGFWNEDNYGIKIRRILSKVRSVYRSINTDNKVALGLFLDASSVFSSAINELAIKIFGKLVWHDDKDDFDKELKVLLWGGYDSYQYYNDIRNKMLQQTLVSEQDNLRLPEWQLFLQLVRECIERPLSTSTAALIIKEYAFSFFSKKNMIESKQYLKVLATHDRYAIKQAILMVNYFSKCAMIPREASDAFAGDLMKLTRE